jgi:hypothetical protein
LTTFERLAKRIKKDLGIDLINFRRTYAGHHQKSAGNWIWGAYNAENAADDIGSCYSATELLKSKKKLILYEPGFPYATEILIDN